MVQVAVLAALLAVVALPVALTIRLAPTERRPVLAAMAVAFAIRLVVSLVLHATGAWKLTGRGAVTPDEATVDLAARLLTAGDPRSPLEIGGSLHTSWLLLSWAVYDLVWNNLLAIKLINVVLGTLLVVPVHRLGVQLHSPRAGRVSAWLVAVFPTAIIWSALAMRESLLALVLAGLLAIALTPLPPRWRARAGLVALTVAGLVLLAFTRSYMLPLLMLLLLATAVLRRSARDLVGVVVAVGLTVGVIAALPTGQLLLRTTTSLVAEPAANIYNPLSHCDSGEGCPTGVDPNAAGSSFGRLKGSALHQPASDGSADLSASLQSAHGKGFGRAFAIAILAGRPVWRTAEFFLLLQPGVVLWWALLPLAVFGAVVLARRRRWDGLAATAGYAAALVVFLAYTGQFIRHHYMLEPACLVLAAVGGLEVLAGAGTRVRRIVVAAVGVMAVAALASVGASLAT